MNLRQIELTGIFVAVTFAVMLLISLGDRDVLIKRGINDMTRIGYTNTVVTSTQAFSLRGRSNQCENFSSVDKYGELVDGVFCSYVLGPTEIFINKNKNDELD